MLEYPWSGKLDCKFQEKVAESRVLLIMENPVIMDYGEPWTTIEDMLEAETAEFPLMLVAYALAKIWSPNWSPSSDLRVVIDMVQ